MVRGSDYFTTQSDVAVAAEMIFRCCQACLVGPGQAVEEMSDPSRRWATQYIWERQRRVSPPDRNDHRTNSHCLLDDRSRGSEVCS